MKKLCLVLVFVSVFGPSIFCGAGEQEGVDFLLFLPNSRNRFVNETKAMLQLDNVANYLLAKNLSPGKISVYGYAAAAANGIEPVKLSRERALHVINELQKRGLGRDLFAEPVACGSVDLWGGNTSEADRSPNRRVSIVLDDIILTLPALKTVCAWQETPGGKNPPEVIQHLISAEKTKSEFPWWIIPLALFGIALILPVIISAPVRRRS